LIGLQISFYRILSLLIDMKKWLIGVIVGVVLVALIISEVVVYLSKPKQWKTYENKEGDLG
jgi:hypothetical protein